MKSIPMAIVLVLLGVLPLQALQQVHSLKDLPVESVAGAAAVPDSEVAEGYVYEDHNSNGTRDDGEKGVAGVQVSNQREVVITDNNGYYRLPLEKGSIIFISKPAGYKLYRNEYNLPQFYYMHRPGGTPDLKFDGVEPTGALPNPLNFGLIPAAKKDTFKAIIFGDPQPRDNRELTYYRDDVVAELANVDADLTLVLGDIMFDDLSLYERYNRVMKTVGTPVINVFGNHDVNYDASNNLTSKQTFKSHYGPTYFSFDYGDVHFVTLDNIDYLGRDNKGPAYRGHLSEKQLEWIENDLQHVEEDKLIVFLSHIPLYSHDGDGIQKNTVNRDRLLELLQDWEQVLYLSAHRHRLFHDFLGKKFQRKEKKPIHHIALTAASGAWWSGPKNEDGIPITLQRDGVPNGYHIFEFSGNTYTDRYKGAGHAPDFQLRIERPLSGLSAEEADSTELLVNVFNGNEKSKVAFQINRAGKWHPMKRLDSHYSPYYEQMMEGERKPPHTPHMWCADLPDLAEGMHVIKVRTKDMYGHEYSRTKIIEVKPTSVTPDSTKKTEPGLNE